VIRGVDLNKRWSVAAEVRAFRPPEPYKAKGAFVMLTRFRRKEAGKKK